MPPLHPRQVVVTEGGNGGGGGGGSSGNNGLDTGAIVGIVIGVIAAILLLWWIIKSCSQPRGRGSRDGTLGEDRSQGWYDDSHPRSRSRSAGGHRHGRRHSRHGPRHHGRRRSSASRTTGVVLEEKVAGYAVPAHPAPAYVYPSAGGAARRSRSRSQGRYYTTTSGY